MEFAELVKRCIRIFYISRKPTPAEWSKVAKVCAFGMFLFGLVGFIISFVFGFLR
ncbi:MAG: protein translocase SEC61 complex subunit gamma [Candidatus ainarchaeum sp.]|nr:protein translocase SEC61 complex subunit gamma [Candidatus ainarchaeum sp.]